MSEMFRTSKIKHFIELKVVFMIGQQRVIDAMKSLGQPDELLNPLYYNQTAIYNYTFDLCKEFGIEMPVIPGVTPNATAY